MREGEEEYFERASGAEICGYFDEVMRHRLLNSGKVRFFPMCDYLGDHSFRSRVSGEVHDVVVRRRLVDSDLHGVAGSVVRAPTLRGG